MRIEPHALRRSLRDVNSADDFMAGVRVAPEIVVDARVNRFGQNDAKTLILELEPEARRIAGSGRVAGR